MPEKKEAFKFEEYKEQALADLQAGKPLVGKGGVLTPLIKEFLETALQGEINAHMASCIEDPAVDNRRNGVSKKDIKSPLGMFELETRRDRNGSFEPKIVKKRQTVLNESLDNKILGLYGLGMTLRWS